MTDNTDEEYFDNPTNTQLEYLADETITSKAFQ